LAIPKQQGWEREGGRVHVSPPSSRQQGREKQENKMEKQRGKKPQKSKAVVTRVSRKIDEVKSFD